MNTRNFFRLLEARWARGLFVCVGLDSDFGKIPEVARRQDVCSTILAFNSAIVDATKDLVCAYKPNIAFYEAYGDAGWLALRETVVHIHKIAPDVPVILDAKRGDIGNTNAGYMRMAFDFLQVDAITAPPYLGRESLKPFLDQENKGIIVLCRTSNPGASEFQDVLVNVTEEMFAEIHRGQPADNDGFAMPKTVPFYKYVAYRVAARSTGWNKNGNCAVVVGATYPDELREVRQIVGDMPILIPGIGKQGGDIKKTVAAGIDSRGQGIIVNSSRGIIFASGGSDFAEAARRETIKLSDTINDCRRKGK